MNLCRKGILSLLLVHASCSPQSRSNTDGSPRDLVRSASEFYEAYGRDLRAHSRTKLSQYYDPDGATVIFEGERRFLSRAALDSFYQNTWPAPAYFDWDSLSYDSLSPELVAVTGAFRWLPGGSRDTARYLYASILRAADSGLVIRLEHETGAPKKR
jgi:hypothetical protein